MATPADLALADLGGEPMARDPDRRVSIAPLAGKKVWSPDARAAPAASYAILGFGQPAAPEQAAPATGSGRAAAQEAARRIREQS